ncbi:MAG: transglycosylase SLT domain-containing protein [Clostridia bacterium]|nr:transglycosylase SLT domain-containing protein [Clostridia bacterium]
MISKTLRIAAAALILAAAVLVPVVLMPASELPAASASAETPVREDTASPPEAARDEIPAGPDGAGDASDGNTDDAADALAGDAASEVLPDSPAPAETPKEEYSEDKDDSGLPEDSREPAEDGKGADADDVTEAGDGDDGMSWAEITATVGYDVVFTNYLHPTLGRYYKVALSPELQHHTYEMCLKYRVPYKIVIALMGIESSWNADIGVLKNSSGSYVGLGMLSVKYNAGVFRERGIDIYQPEGNIEAICRVFSDKLREFDGNVHYALMAYNMGSGGAWAAIARGTLSTSYSRKIVNLAEGLLTDVEYAVITKK